MSRRKSWGRYAVRLELLLRSVQVPTEAFRTAALSGAGGLKGRRQRRDLVRRPALRRGGARHAGVTSERTRRGGRGAAGLLDRL
eukprot:2426837-Pleurochrysis_carterae.AAC.1